MLFVIINPLLSFSRCETEDLATFGLEGFTLVVTLFLIVLKPTTLGYLAIIALYMLVIASYVLLLMSTVILGPFNVDQGNGFFAAWIVLYGAINVLHNYEWNLSEL